MLKDVILVAGADAVVRACPPKQTIRQGLDNIIKTFPGEMPSFLRALSAPTCRLRVQIEQQDAD